MSLPGNLSLESRPAFGRDRRRRAPNWRVRANGQKHCSREQLSPIHSDIDIAVPFLKELCKQLGIDPKDII